MTAQAHSYLMENLDEAVRLEIKTNPEAVRKQALWCGIKPGLRVLDAGCGPGKITSILHEMIQPGGEILGLDYSNERIEYAKKQYGAKPGIQFQTHDLRKPLSGIKRFDLVWARFVLEYNRVESRNIVKNLADVLRPGGCLCLLDLDHNCLNHYELPPKMEKILFQTMEQIEKTYNFDPYSGRKLYAYQYDLGQRDIQVHLMPHHLIYGKLRDEDLFNWIKKVEVALTKTKEIFENYPGGHDTFFSDFTKFFLNPRRFTYAPLILCKGIKPDSLT